MATNLEGPFVLCRATVPQMIAGGGGAITTSDPATPSAGSPT
jgi:NAD(P)-dependent dehydrogenase (short-subunit alcohol dehydrogenase family)